MNQQQARLFHRVAGDVAALLTEGHQLTIADVAERFFELGFTEDESAMLSVALLQSGLVWESQNRALALHPDLKPIARWLGREVPLYILPRLVAVGRQESKQETIATIQGKQAAWVEPTKYRGGLMFCTSDGTKAKASTGGEAIALLANWLQLSEGK